MDAFRGRTQTTKGIWIAKCNHLDTFTIALDLEGTDSRERGQDDTTFERQSALFALATANIVLINIWCHDIGREHASTIPLLRTVFEVMMHLFNPRKTTLLFVIRDKTRTPLESLEHTLREDIQEVWADVARPEALEDTPLSEFFNVEFAALPSFEENELRFEEQVDQLRLQISNCISPGSLLVDGVGFVPASGLSYSMQQIWGTIKSNQDLDLPSHKVMVAFFRCEEIAKEKLKLLMYDEEWVSLEKAVQAGPLTEFGKKVSSILELYLSKYDEESIYFDRGIRNDKRQELESRALDVVHNAYNTMLGHVCSETFKMFKTRMEGSLHNEEELAAAINTHKESSMLLFNEACEDAAIKQASWDASKILEKLHDDIEKHVSSVKHEKLLEYFDKYEKRLTDALNSAVESLFETCGTDTWAEIRMHVRHQTGNAISDFSKAVHSLGLDESTIDTKRQQFWEYARKLVEKRAREEVGKAVFRMKDRFSMILNYDKDSEPRVWTRKEEIITITNVARSAALKILSVNAAIRLDQKSDNIEEVLFSTFMDERYSEDGSTGLSYDPFASNTWEEVSPNATLLPPKQCESLWIKFLKETEHEVSRAISAQELHKLMKRRESLLWTVAESAGAAAVGTATGVALVAVGVAAAPAVAVGGTAGLVAAAATAVLK